MTFAFSIVTTSFIVVPVEEKEKKVGHQHQLYVMKWIQYIYMIIVL